MGCHGYPSVNNAGGKLRRGGPGIDAPLILIPQPYTQENNTDTSNVPPLVNDTGTFIVDTYIKGFNSTDVQETLRKLGFLNGNVNQWW